MVLSLRIADVAKFKMLKFSIVNWMLEWKELIVDNNFLVYYHHLSISPNDEFLYMGSNWGKFLFILLDFKKIKERVNQLTTETNKTSDVTQHILLYEEKGPYRNMAYMKDTNFFVVL